MNTFRLFNHQARRLVATGALLVATLVPALVPALVSAETVTSRSVALSSSVKGTDDVTYEVKFNAQHAGTGAFIVDFCDSAAVGTTCTTPAGVDTTNVDTSGGDTVSPANSNNGVKVVLASSVGVGGAVDVVLTGIHNPTNAGALYARIVTYADDTAVGTNTSASPGTHYDDGSVALAITDGFSVKGSVLESLLFCASTDTITDNCSDGAELAVPNVSLGTNGVLGTTLSEGTIHSQISTNAASGAVVNLKSDAVGCGGLKREGAPTACDITPVSGSAADIEDNTAKFGLKLGTPSAATGEIDPVAHYNTTNYFMNYVVGDGSGVTSTYGDPIYNTHGGPVNNGAIDLTFGAATSNVTPAGNYSAALNLIATGKF